MQSQITLKKAIVLSGVGLHKGNLVTIKLIPAEDDHGIVFKRVDIKDNNKNIIPARYDLVRDTKLCTMLINDYGVSVGTIEHLMSALAIFAIDNLLIEIDASEVPILDGSSIKFVEAIESAGLEYGSSAKKQLKIIKPIHLKTENWEVSFLPSDYFELDVTIDFDDKVIGKQQVVFNPSVDNYKEVIAKARTFCLEKEIKYLQANGLALGGSLDNAIVVGEKGILNPEGLRDENEFVKHKLLDAIGDLYLSGYNIIGKFIGYKCGHGANNEILRKLFSDESSYEIETEHLVSNIVMFKELSNMSRQ